MAQNKLVVLVIAHRISRTWVIHFYWLFIFIAPPLVIDFE